MNNTLITEALTLSANRLAEDLSNPSCENIVEKTKLLLELQIHLNQINDPISEACFCEMQAWFSLADVWKDTSQIAAAITLAKSQGIIRSDEEMRKVYGDIAFLNAKREYIKWYNNFEEALEG